MVVTLVLFGALFSGSELRAQEHPGEHPGKEAKIKPDQVKEAILDYIRWDTKLKGGSFLIWDDKEQRVWNLDFSELHKKVMVLEDKTYFACVDFNAQMKQPDGSVKTATLDIDFWLEKEDLSMKEIRLSRLKNEESEEYPAEKYWSGRYHMLGPYHHSFYFERHSHGERIEI
jgi:hypothetical protein